MKNFTITFALLCMSCVFCSANAQTTTDSIAAEVPMLINDSIITETVVPETVVDTIDSTIMAIEEVATLDSSAVIKECVKNDVISYFDKLAIFK